MSFDNPPEETVINGYKFLMLSNACSEQYDVIFGGKKVAYIRLRHGSLTVNVPDIDGPIFFQHSFGNSQGQFFDETERKSFLELIQKKLSYRE